MAGHLECRGARPLPFPQLRARPMTIRDWPITERPRERLLTHGAKVLTDGELLAVLLGSGNRGGSAVELGRQLIASFGSLHAVLNATREKCLHHRGIGPARYASLQAAL